MRKVALLTLLIAAGVLAYACGDTSHIFVARQYEEGRDCLAQSESVDVVVGDAPPWCDAACLTQPADDGGPDRVVWVSWMCAPYPWNFDAAATDPACAAALAAASRSDTCLDDGGSTHARIDAGDDAASADAGPDAADDAAGHDAGLDAADAAADAGDAAADAG